MLSQNLDFSYEDMSPYNCHRVSRTNWNLLGVWHILSVVQMSYCLRLTLLKVPESRPAGFDVKLSCHIDLEGDILYTVRWFHNDKEFYRFSPSEEPNVMFFPKKGIYIDVNRSTNISVVLQDLDAFSAGLFRCEVLADAPFFQTVSAEAFMFIGEFYSGVKMRTNNCNLIILFSAIVKLFFL